MNAWHLVHAQQRCERRPARRTVDRKKGEGQPAHAEHATVIEAPQVVDLGFKNIVEPWKFSRTNPTGIRSKREQTTIARGQRVWRLRYRYEATEHAAAGAGLP